MSPLDAYDAMREMHKVLKRAVAPDVVSYMNGRWFQMDRRIKRRFQKLSAALYEAEKHMVDLEANAKPGEFT